MDIVGMGWYHCFRTVFEAPWLPKKKTFVFSSSILIFHAEWTNVAFDDKRLFSKGHFGSLI